jgi:hypothetical protein
MTATATRGADYALQTNGVTFTNNSIIMPAGASSSTISLIASNDTTAELTETATLNITGTAFYSAGTPNSAAVVIVDDEVPSADVSAVLGSAFEANTNDYIRLRITRRGDTNAPSFTVNLNYTGNAISNVDYVAGGPVTIDPGVVTSDFDSFPIDDSLLETNETFVVTVAAGTGYNIGTNSVSAIGTIIEDETPPEAVLFADNFNGDSSTNWTIRFAAGNGVDDYRVNENPNAFPPAPYDYSADGLPPAPHGNDTLGVKLTVNKNDGAALGGAGLNLYPNGQSFSGNFALRFDMYLIINSGSGTTEYGMFGINHSGNFTNWFRSSGDGIGAGGAVDGLFYQVEADAAALGDYGLNTTPVFLGGATYNPTTVASRTAATLTGVFKSPPWGASGAPANLQGTTTPGWAQVEVNQIGNVVTLKINNTSIMTYTNNGVFQSGNIMLGYDDAFDSNTGTGAAVIYDNVRVVALGRPLITNIQRSGTNAIIDFTWSLDDATSAFTVQKATTVAGPYAGVAGTTIARISPGAYRATTPAPESAAFFRIRR